MRQKTKNEDFSERFSVTLDNNSLLGNMLVGRVIARTGYGNKGKGIVRAGYGSKGSSSKMDY